MAFSEETEYPSGVSSIRMSGSPFAIAQFFAAGTRVKISHIEFSNSQAANFALQMQGGGGSGGTFGWVFVPATDHISIDGWEADDGLRFVTGAAIGLDITVFYFDQG